MRRGTTSGRAWIGLAGTVLLSIVASGAAMAQSAAQAADTEKELEKYREMINDPMANPGYLNVDRGEDLWKKPRGKKNVSLETCDLGEGPGKLEGAYARLPRYFKDADAVMDLEQRLLWCMKNIQDLDVADVIARKFSKPGKTSDMEDLVAFISNKSNGMKIEAQLAHPKEKEALALGERLFYTRASVLDFSCATCHLDSGRRIRLQPLPQLSKPGRDARDVVGSWPAYRVSQSASRTMQHRLYDCYWQSRMPPLDYAAPATTALMLFLAKQGNGAEINVPSIKR